MLQDISQWFQFRATVYINTPYPRCRYFFFPTVNFGSTNATQILKWIKFSSDF
jgi:hypothetical protein